MGAGVELNGGEILFSQKIGVYMKKMMTKFLLGIFLAVFGVGAGGVTPQYCTGTVGHLWIDNYGTVLVRPSYRGDHTRICNLNEAIGSVSTINCRAWFAMLTSAVMRQSDVIIYYDDAPACNVLPVYWSTPIPGYVMQIN